MPLFVMTHRGRGSNISIGMMKMSCIGGIKKGVILICDAHQSFLFSPC